MSSAGRASSMAMSNSLRSSAAMIYAPVAPDEGFKACCMKSGSYDGANRNYYFWRVGGEPPSSQHRHSGAAKRRARNAQQLR
jgi:hypothetical protein